MEKKFTQRCRLSLENELAQLRDSAAGLAEAGAVVELDQQRVGRLSRMDAMQQQAMASAQAGRGKQRIQKIRSALGRMDDGSWGACLECEEPIATGRLEADPAALWCIECAADKA